MSAEVSQFSSAIQWSTLFGCKPFKGRKARALLLILYINAKAPTAKTCSAEYIPG